MYMCVFVPVTTHLRRMHGSENIIDKINSHTTIINGPIVHVRETFMEYTNPILFCPRKPDWICFVAVSSE